MLLNDRLPTAVFNASSVLNKGSLETFRSSVLRKHNIETYNTVYPRRKNYKENQTYVPAKGCLVGTTLKIRKFAEELK